MGVIDHVFGDGAEADGMEDLRFLLLGEADRLGVTTTFKIEDPVVSPAMLVITDQPPLRIGGKAGLASAGKPEKQRAVTVFAHIGGTVHRENPAQWQQIIHDREKRFF